MPLVNGLGIGALSGVRNEVSVGASYVSGLSPRQRIGRLPRGYAEAGVDDAPRAHRVEQSVEQNTPVHDGHGFDFQPGHRDTARWPAQIGEAEARLDGGKLIVAGRRSPREVGDGACIHPDLLGDMVEHDRRQQLACAQMPPRKAEARSEEHTSELQSLMRISYAVFCLK